MSTQELFNGVPVYAHERLEALRDGFYIIQNPAAFCFGIDAVLLADFAAPALRRKYAVAELGTGTGIIALLVADRSPVRALTAFEIQPDMAEMAARSVRLNGLEDRIRVVAGDFKTQNICAPGSLDAVLSNPPYSALLAEKKPCTRALVNPNKSLALARHEIACTAEDVFRFAGNYLKDRGRLFLVHRPQRLAELIVTAARHQMVFKRVRLVHSRAGKPAELVLIEAVKRAKDGMNVEPPLFIYDGAAYTEEINRIYRSPSPQRQILKQAEDSACTNKEQQE